MLAKNCFDDLPGVLLVRMILKKPSLNIFSRRLKGFLFFQEPIVDTLLEIFIEHQVARVYVSQFDETFGFLFAGARIVFVDQAALAIHEIEKILPGPG